MAEQVIILIPVFNDEAALNKLLEEMAISIRDLHDMKFKVLVVDDGSTGKLTIHSPGTLPIHLLRLQRNIGHQKAIAIGLAFIQANDACDKVLVMDSDGEDRPEDAISLLRHSLKEPDTIIFAARKSRQENAEFRLFYYLYKFAFKILTGKKIAFGNFLVVPRPLLDKVVHYSEIWNHIAGGILKNRAALYIYQHPSWKTLRREVKYEFYQAPHTWTWRNFRIYRNYCEPLADIFLIVNCNLRHRYFRFIIY